MVGPVGRRRAGAAAAVALTVWASAGMAQAPAPQPDYHPSLADIMTMAVQPRHAKLGVAGRNRNWPYLAYETNELRAAMARVARTIPTYRQTDMAAMIASDIKEPIDAMEAAVKARDPQRFDAAYVRVTEACNACHEGLGHPYIVIRPPAASSFPDQDLSVPRAGPGRRSK